MEFATKTPRRLNFATYAGSLRATFQPRFSATLIGGPRQQASRRGLVGSYVAGWPESSSRRKIDRIGGFQKKFQKWKKVGLTTPGRILRPSFFFSHGKNGRFSCATREKSRFSHFCAIPFSQLWVGGCEWPWREALAGASFAAWFPNKRG